MHACMCMSPFLRAGPRADAWSVPRCAGQPAYPAQQQGWAPWVPPRSHGYAPRPEQQGAAMLVTSPHHPHMQHGQHHAPAPALQPISLAPGYMVGPQQPQRHQQVVPLVGMSPRFHPGGHYGAYPPPAHLAPPLQHMNGARAGATPDYNCDVRILPFPSSWLGPLIIWQCPLRA